MAYKDPWVKKAKWLTQALIISGTLNVGLLSTFIYSAFKKNESTLGTLDHPKQIPNAKEKLGLEELVASYKNSSYQDLLLGLGNHHHVQQGLTKRDLALAMLVEKHHFNLERALGGLTLQKREIFINSEKIAVYPGLADYQFQAIVSYAKTEKWPLTAKGLYLEIQSSKPPYDPTLIEAFALTPECHFISMLFSKTGIALKKEHIIALLSQSKWPVIVETTEHLRQNATFTVDERRRFLLQLAEERSRLAAKIFLETDHEYCLKDFDNDQILYLCNLLGDKTPPIFLKDLLQSPRSDEIWQKAAAILYEQAAEKLPENLELVAAKRRFLELKATPVQTPPRKAARTNAYTIKSGDSLWKIARSHNITVKALRDANNLKTDRLKPGETLRIPQST